MFRPGRNRNLMGRREDNPPFALLCEVRVFERRDEELDGVACLAREHVWRLPRITIWLVVLDGLSYDVFLRFAPIEDFPEAQQFRGPAGNPGRSCSRTPGDQAPG